MQRLRKSADKCNARVEKSQADHACMRKKERYGLEKMNLNLRPASECKFDAVSLGEVMLRLDPGEGRIRTARSFRAWEGGGEYNVIRGLRKCFKMNTAVITAFADNEVGMLMEDFICQGGVDTSLIKWMKTDGIGRICRNGLNYQCSRSTGGRADPA